jgi:hypothetical protein
VAISIKIDLPIYQSEERPVSACANILTGDEFGSALANQYTSSRHELTTIALHSQPLADAIAAISNTALTFLVCHKPTLLIKS